MLVGLDGVNNLFESLYEYIDAAWMLARNQKSLLMKFHCFTIFNDDFAASIGNVAHDVVRAGHLSSF